MRKGVIALLFLLSACAPSATPAAAPSPTATLGPSPQPTPLPSPSPTPIVYVVQSGDTLAGIAALYGTTADEICAFNALEDCSLIYPGDELLIPSEGVVLPSPTPPAASPTQEAPSPTQTPAPATPSPVPPTPTEEAALLPPPEDMGPVSAEGNAEIRIDNDTPYVLTLEFQGATSHTVSIERCSECKEYSFMGPVLCPSGRPSVTFRLPPGTYQATARVDAPDVTPFAGTWVLEGDRRYGHCFFIVTQFQ